LAVWSN